MLCCLLAACLVALAAWVVHVSNPKPLTPIVAHEDEPNPSQAEPAKYRETVQRALEFLIKNQAKDGHWEGDGGQHPVAMTGLAGLAVLMDNRGGNPWIPEMAEPLRTAKSAASIHKAADWLMARSQAGRDGLIFSEHASETARYMQGHGLATLFLAGVCKDEPDALRRKKLTDVLMRAVKYIVKAQSSQGGWYHTSKVEGHDFDSISATVIQIQALQAAENAGIPVLPESINDAKEYLKAVLGKVEEAAKAGHNPSRPAETAAALACIASISPSAYSRVRPKDELHEKWFKYCQAEIPVGRDIKLGRDELTHYYYAQAVFNLGGDAWSGYRTAMFDHLQSTQNKDGSWPAGDGISVGPVYSTAVWCTILQLEKRSHPSRSPEAMIMTTTRRLEPWPGLRLAMRSVREPKAS